MLEEQAMVQALVLEQAWVLELALVLGLVPVQVGCNLHRKNPHTTCTLPNLWPDIALYTYSEYHLGKDPPEKAVALEWALESALERAMELAPEWALE